MATALPTPDYQVLFPDAIHRVESENKNNISNTYRKAGKVGDICKGMPTTGNEQWTDADGIQHDKGLPTGCPMFGKPWCATEKKDGTQIHIVIPKDSDKIQFLSHNDNPVIPSHPKITLEQLKKGNDKGKPFEYQGGNLTLNGPPMITGFQEMMKDLDVDELHVYCELTFKVGQKTPRRIPYPDAKMNQLQFFCMCFIHTNSEGKREAVKVSVTPSSQSFFSDYGINCVPIVMSGDSFSVADFENILSYVDDNEDVEGLVFDQVDEDRSSYLKLLTRYSSETVNKFEISSKFGEYRELQNVYVNHMTAMQQIKKEAKQKHKGLNWDLVNAEIAKTISHDSWLQFRRDFYNIPGTEKDRVYGHIRNSDFNTELMKSLGEDKEFTRQLSKNGKKQIVKAVVTYLVANKSDLKPTKEDDAGTKAGAKEDDDEIKEDKDLADEIKEAQSELAEKLRKKDNEILQGWVNKNRTKNIKV